jgi:thiaminase/transcriptional activator TenA
MSAEWTTEAYERAKPIWSRIFEHPFLSEIRAGTLPEEKLIFYFEQNTKFIETAVRCRSVAAAKSDDRDTLSFFTVRTTELMEELEHQREMLRSMGGNPDAPTAPGCQAYINHLQVVAWSRPPEWYVGTFLPCPWTYDLIAETFEGRLSNPLHEKWWAFYWSAEHNALCDRYREFADRYVGSYPASRRELMIEDFLLNSRYELRFWDMAYNKETWDV